MIDKPNRFYNWLIGLSLCFACMACPVHAKDQAIEVKADTLRILSKQQTASFSGNVRATYGDLRFHCQKMTVIYDDKGNIVSLKATGKVIVIKDGTKATAQHATLHAAKGIITLTGNPVLTRDNNKLSGKSIEVHIRSGKVQVLEATGTFVFKQGLRK